MIKYFNKARAIYPFRVIELSLSNRNGEDYCIMKTCVNCFGIKGFPHMRGFYIHFGRLGGHILWKSHKCYETISHSGEWMAARFFKDT